MANKRVMRITVQDHLRNDVALDLVGAAVDRDLAIVAVRGGERRGVGGAGDAAQVAFLARAALEGQGVGPDRVHHQLAQRLLDLGALDLQDRSLRPGCALLRFRGQHAQLGHLERHQIDLDLRDARANSGSSISGLPFLVSCRRCPSGAAARAWKRRRPRCWCARGRAETSRRSSPCSLRRCGSRPAP